jgi:hypothetical protein
VASAGSVDLVVWNGLGDGIGAARVDRAGSVLDPTPIRLPSGVRATVGSDGENFLVVWNPNGASSAGLEGVRVSRRGDVLDPSPIVLSEPPVGEPKISFDGTDYLVVWTTDGGIAGTRVSRDGVVIEPVHLLVPTVGYPSIDIAFNGTDHLLTWARPDPDQPPPGPRPVPPLTDLYGTLLARDGSPRHPEGVAISVAPGSQSGPVVTSVGSSFFVAWADSRSGGASDIFGTRVDPTGATVDPAGIPVAAGPAEENGPAVASDGDTALVIWTTRQDDDLLAHGARVDRSGAVLDAAPFPVSTLASDLAVAFDGQDYFAVGYGGGPVLGTRITPGGAVLDPAAIAVSIGANAQLRPDSAFDGTNTLVVWADDRSSGAGVYGGRIGPDGQILDGQGFRISDGPTSNSGSVAFDGTNYLVAWTETRGDDRTWVLRAARVSRAGVVLGRFDVRVGTPNEQPSGAWVAYGGGTFLLVWQETLWRNGGVDTELRATRVSPGGEIADPGGILVTEGTFFGVDLDHGDDGFLLVWTRYGVPPNLDIHGTLVTTAGTLPSPDGFPIATGAASEVTPALAWNGDHHLVVWTSVADPDRFDLAEISGARFDGSGARLDPADLPISTGAAWKAEPRVAANGPFLVTWTDGRRGQFTIDIFGTRVDADGTVAHPDGFEAASGISGVELQPTVGDGNFSMVYDRAVPEQPYATSRAFIRRVVPK